MATDAQFLRALIPTLPTELSTKLRALCTAPATESFLENFVRFIVGVDPSTDATDALKAQWAEKQPKARQVIQDLVNPFQKLVENRKRSHEDANETAGTSEPKRQRLSPPSDAAPATEDPLVFTLHAISTTSPVRKKVDISIRQSNITFTNPSTGNIESTVPLSSIRRAFLLPTRGKSKPHWTVVLLSSDYVDRAKSSNANAQENPQIIFGLDATTTAPLTTTTFTDGGSPTSIITPKGSASLPSIRAFFSHLPHVQIYEPSTDVFKSACNGTGSNASTTGIPGVEAYRAAKPGSLWFMKEGILWGESKPCEFWAVNDLHSASEGVRVSPGSGRVFSVTLTRKNSRGPEDEGGEGSDDDDNMGVETEFGMLDSRERDAVSDWVRKHQNLFGRRVGEAPLLEDSSKPKPKVPQPTGPLTIRQLAAESDSEDEDFEASSSDDGSGSSSEDSASEGGGEGGAEDEEEDAEGTDGGEGSEDEGDLDPARHPLMRPGAVPRMSKAAMEMVVGIVEDDLMGEGEAEEDELDE